MHAPSNEFSPARDRPGLTLVEVVTSTVLLSTLLALLLSAAGAHLRQVRRAQLRLDAVAGLDRLLHEVAGGQRANVLTNSSSHGTLPGTTGLEWTSRRERRRDADQWRADVVRIEVHETRHPNSAAIASMELLSPRPVERSTPP